jgi:hypothetical protein
LISHNGRQKYEKTPNYVDKVGKTIDFISQEKYLLNITKSFLVTLELTGANFGLFFG